MVVVVGFCKIKVDSYFLIVLKIKCTKFHQDLSKTIDLHTKYTNRIRIFQRKYLLAETEKATSGSLPRKSKEAYENLQTL
jgi:hypothetical protein